MSKIKIFLMLSGYQLTWLMCVFGELLYDSFLPEENYHIITPQRHTLTKLIDNLTALKKF